MDEIDRRRFLVATGALGTAGLAGCSGGDGGGSDSSDGGDGGDGGDDEDTDTEDGDGGQQVEERSIQIGTLLPATGQLSGIGSTMVDAADLAFSTVDDNSQYFAVDATFGDSQSTPSGGLSAANNLANAGVPAVVGGAATTVHIQASEQVFVPNGMSACSPSATASSITDIEDDGLLFRTTPSDAFQGQAMAQYATESLGAQTAASLHVNDSYGQALSNEFASAFEDAGGTVQRQVSYETAASSYTSRIERAVQDDPDLIAVVGYAESGIQLFKDYYAQYDPDRAILTVDGLDDARVPNEVGEDMSNVVGTKPAVGGPAQDEFDQLYQDAFDTGPGPFNPQTFDAAAVLLLANAAAGANDGAAISEQMRAVANEGEMTVTPGTLAEGVDAAAEGEDVVYEGASSQVRFDDNGDLTSSNYDIWQYAPDTDSGVEIVDTLSFG
jgi:ABC-type branched-subunit amino acid transport system substrate-binding protein